MSEDRNRGQRPRYSPNRFSRALGIVRSILDDQPLSHQVSPSGELYRAIERYHRGVDRVAESTRHSPIGPAPRSNDPSVLPLSSNPHQDNSHPSHSHGRPGRTFSRGGGSNINNLVETMSGNNNDARHPTTNPSSGDQEPRYHPPSLPPLRLFGSDSQRPSNMSDRQEEQHSSLRRRSALSSLTSLTRADPSQSPGQDHERDRDRIRARTYHADAFHLPHGLPMSDYTFLNEYSQPTINPALISSPAPEDYHQDSRRIKRRKLDNESFSGSRGFRYGYRGQVVPGELKMELVSCDGGMYGGETVYAADNILKDDNSVYCTKGNRCNILFRHQGATVFTLKELVIKAPGRDFDAPVRNGFVFVSLTDDAVLDRTAKYQIQYKMPGRDGSTERQGALGERPRAAPGTYHHPLNEFTSILMESEPDRRYLNPRQRRPYTLSEGLGLDDEYNDNENEYRPIREEEREAQIPEEFSLENSAFNVTTECSDDEDEGTGYGRARNRRAPNRIGSLPFESDSDDGRAQVPSAYGFETFDEIARWRQRERFRRYHGRESGFAEAAEEYQHHMQEAVKAVGGTLLKPLAKFSMDKDKNKCTIKFDPPASARFLLLKIWNPTHDPSGNIDIKAVVVKGYAGPRYFPSIKLR